jgi:hypothetical protein
MDSSSTGIPKVAGIARRDALCLGDERKGRGSTGAPNILGPSEQEGPGSAADGPWLSVASWSPASRDAFSTGARTSRLVRADALCRASRRGAPRGGALAGHPRQNASGRRPGEKERAPRENAVRPLRDALRAAGHGKAVRLTVEGSMHREAVRARRPAIARWPEWRPRALPPRGALFRPYRRARAR